MELMKFMQEKAAILKARNYELEDDYMAFIESVDQEIRKALNLGRGAMNLPQDYKAVSKWLQGFPCSALVDIDHYEGGVFYYYVNC